MNDKKHFEPEEIQRIKDSNPIVDVVGETVTLKRTGASFKALCPFHQEKHPSFTVTPSKGLFKCFGCGVGGDVIKFIQASKGITFVQALNNLADRAGIVL